MTRPRRLRRMLFLAAGTALLSLGAIIPDAGAAGLATLLDPLSPFFMFPPPQAEVRATPIWVWPISGSERGPRLGIKLDAKKDLLLETGDVFLDWTIKFQIGRWAGRLHQNTRNFRGFLPYRGVPGSPAGETRFEYEGLRIGADVDLIQWNGFRAGVNIDQDLYAPVFWQSLVESDLVPQGRKITAGWATTAGIHVSYLTPQTSRGLAGVFEARARWPVSGASVTDWEIAAGLTLPPIQFGTMGVRTGYRGTSVEIRDTEAFDGALVTTEFRIDTGGWFGDVVYYY